MLDYDIRQYRGNAHIVAFPPDFVYPNSRQLAFGIPNNSLFQILKQMFDCRVHRIPIIDRINVAFLSLSHAGNRQPRPASPGSPRATAVRRLHPLRSLPRRLLRAERGTARSTPL